MLQHLELPAAAPAAPVVATGALLVQTEPSGQTVSVDGVDRGTSPLTIPALAAGDHAVVVRGARRSSPSHGRRQGGRDRVVARDAHRSCGASTRMAQCADRPRASNCVRTASCSALRRAIS